MKYIDNSFDLTVPFHFQIDQLIVKQKVEMLEAFTGFETKNKYTVKNSMGQDVYKAKEDTDCCTRNICGPQRPYCQVSIYVSLFFQNFLQF